MTFTKSREILTTIFLLVFITVYPQVVNINVPSGNNKNFDQANNLAHSESLITGYPVYHIIANGDGSKRYYFHTLNAYNTGLYIDDGSEVVNLNDLQTASNQAIEKAIGDCIYNPFRDELLVSENSELGVIKVYNALDDTWVKTISLYENGAQVKYPREMFLSPDGKLYVMANMRNEGADPKVFVIDAVYGDYSYDHTSDVYTVVMPQGAEGEVFEFYSGHFCYNPSNKKVYATIHPTETTYDPYHTVTNSMFDFNTTINDAANGVLIWFDETGMQIANNLVFPGKIICPDDGNPNTVSQFDGRVFIIGKKFYAYNVSAESFVPTDGMDQPFNDITYNRYMDTLYAIRDIEDECPSDRRAGVFKIYYDTNNSLEFERLDTPSSDVFVDGQATCIFNNPYDNLIYIHNKIDDDKLGGTKTKLYRFDPAAATFTLDYQDLQNTSHYTELDHCSDYHFYLYNITTPFIDPYTNQIYLPGGGHSCVSRVGFTPHETLLIDEGDGKSAWISFPRLERAVLPNGEALVDDVIGKDDEGNDLIEPGGYEAFTSYLENLPLNAEYIVYNVYQDPNWQTGGDLPYMYSNLGYKLTLAYDEPHPIKWVHLYGDVLERDYSFDIYDSEEGNWVGYYNYQEQDAFVALANVLDELYLIKARDWTCVWTVPCGAQPGSEPGCWFCNDQEHKVKYGDMLVLYTDTGQLNFQWNYAGAMLGEDPTPAPEYYTYTELPDYTAIVVELDSADQPSEIGAFAGDTCIGANTVLPGDSVVVVRAYLDGQSSDSVSFEQYYDSLKTTGVRRHDYMVQNRRSGLWERRTLKSHERQPCFFVSFKEKPQKEPVVRHSETGIHVYPNPFHGNTTIEYTIAVRSEVCLHVYDMCGRQVNTLVEGRQEAGKYQVNYPGADSFGNSLQAGVYILGLVAGEEKAQSKLIIMR